MAKITVNFDKKCGKIKPLHGVGQPPFVGTDFSYFHYLTEANIPFSRLHDVGGAYGGNLYADIPNLFRDFDANEYDPASYDFTFTDLLLRKLVEAGVEPYFRLGVTIENHIDVKAYRINPPKDPAKWARICEHVIRHYNEGWANGFHYGITYWEIWNEPDNGINDKTNQMWSGTPEEFYELYRVTSKHLRACFGDSIKIGGYASCGFYAVNDINTPNAEALGLSEEPNDWEMRTAFFVRFFDGFLDMVKKEQLPLDFFSHHSYGDVQKTVFMNRYAAKRLAEAGYGDVEIHLNEWHTFPGKATRGTDKCCASATAMLLAMQNEKMDVMCYYDARMGLSIYGGLFNPMTETPYCTYYGFKAFGKLYKMGVHAACTSDTEGLYAVAATDKTGSEKGILIANIGEETMVETGLTGDFAVYEIDEAHLFAPSEKKADRFALGNNKVVYIEKKQA